MEEIGVAATENQQLTDRLKAARENNRIAHLQAEILALRPHDTEPQTTG